jgi:hypothetical protein
MLTSENSGSDASQSPRRKRLYQFLVMLFFGLFILGANMPALDYAKRESLAYLRQPTEENLELLQANQKEQRTLQWLHASPLASAGIICAIPLLTKYRRKT